MPEPGNPQSLNRYSYCHNNPLKYVDPTGHWQDPLWAWNPETHKYTNAHGEEWVDPTGNDGPPDQYFEKDPQSGLWNMVDSKYGKVMLGLSQLPVVVPQPTPAATNPMGLASCHSGTRAEADYYIGPLPPDQVPAWMRPEYDPSGEKAAARGREALARFFREQVAPHLPGFVGEVISIGGDAGLALVNDPVKGSALAAAQQLGSDALSYSHYSPQTQAARVAISVDLQLMATAAVSFLAPEVRVFEAGASVFAGFVSRRVLEGVK